MLGANPALTRHRRERWQQGRLGAPPERSSAAVHQANLSLHQAPSPRLTDAEREEFCTRTRQWLERHDAGTNLALACGSRWKAHASPSPRFPNGWRWSIRRAWRSTTTTALQPDRLQSRLERALLGEVTLWTAVVPGRDDEGRAAATTASRPANGFLG
jgi:hypothetical protein